MKKQKVYDDPNIIEEIIKLIRGTGTDKKIWEQIGWTYKQYNQMLRDRPDIAERIKEAKREFLESISDAQIAQANKVLNDYLYERVLEYSDIVETTNEVQYLPGGQQIIIERTIKRQQSTKKGCPKWVIDRILGPNMAEMDALKVLVNAGWLPKEVLAAVVDGSGELRGKVLAALAPSKSS